MTTGRDGVSVPITDDGDYERGRRDGYQQCLASTTEWTGLKESLDRLSELIERLLHGTLDEDEDGSPYWRSDA